MFQRRMPPGALGGLGNTGYWGHHAKAAGGEERAQQMGNLHPYSLLPTPSWSLWCQGPSREVLPPGSAWPPVLGTRVTPASALGQSQQAGSVTGTVTQTTGPEGKGADCLGRSKRTSGRKGQLSKLELGRSSRGGGGVFPPVHVFEISKQEDMEAQRC